MKILLASPYGGVPGGISRWTEHIIRYYNSIDVKDCDLTLLPMGRTTFVNINSSLFYRLKSAFSDYRVILRSFNKIIKHNRFNIMHLTSSASISLLKDLYMLKKAQQKGIKTVIHFRFGRIPELKLKNNWEWKLLLKVIKRADVVIVLDKMSYDLLKSCGYENIVILPNPIAPNVLDIVSKNLDTKREKNTVLFAGHVVKTKGVYELVEACGNIPGVKLILVGHVEESMKADLLKKAKCNIEIMGELPYEDVIKEMLKCDIFVLPTHTEGFPNVILESMAAGCTILTTNVGAIPQMLEEEHGKRYGIIVQPKDTVSLTREIKRLLLDEGLKNECRDNVKERVRERYSIESIWVQMCTIWQGMLK